MPSAAELRREWDNVVMEYTRLFDVVKSVGEVEQRLGAGQATRIELAERLVDLHIEAGRCRAVFHNFGAWMDDTCSDAAQRLGGELRRLSAAQGGGK